MPKYDRFLRPSIAANILDVDERTVLKLVEDGALKAIRVRRQWRITPPSWREFLNKTCTPNQAALAV